MDVGGQSTKWNLYGDKGVVKSGSFNTWGKDSKFVLEQIASVYKSFEDEDIVLSLSVPGAVVNDSIVNGVTGISGWGNGLKVKNALLELLGKATKILMSNDANCAGYAEYCQGAAKGMNPAVILTLGTGIGGSLIIDGKIIEGFNGFGAEYGYSFVALDNFEKTGNASEFGGFGYIMKKNWSRNR